MIIINDNIKFNGKNECSLAIVALWILILFFFFTSLVNLTNVKLLTSAHI